MPYRQARLTGLNRGEIIRRTSAMPIKLRYAPQKATQGGVTKAVGIARVKFIGTALLTLASIEPASACHWFSIWNYPWKQHCGVAASKSIGIAQVVPPLPPARDNDIPLPDRRWRRRRCYPSALVVARRPGGEAQVRAEATGSAGGVERLRRARSPTLEASACGAARGYNLWPA
jgi:hypothetical protein